MSEEESQRLARETARRSSTRLILSKIFPAHRNSSFSKVEFIIESSSSKARVAAQSTATTTSSSPSSLLVAMSSRFPAPFAPPVSANANANAAPVPPSSANPPVPMQPAGTTLKNLSESKLINFAIGNQKKSRFQKAREEAEAKKKADEEEAAKAYEEFVESFKDSREDAVKTFVRPGEKPTKPQKVRELIVVMTISVFKFISFCSQSLASMLTSQSQ